MKILRSILLMLLTLSLLLALAACKEEEPFESGTPMTPGEVGDLKTDLENKQEEQGGGDEEPENPEEPQAPEGTAPQVTTVYWLPKGSVYHSDENCYHIRGKANVESGTVAAATEAGKDRLCSACAD